MRLLGGVNRCQGDWKRKSGCNSGGKEKEGKTVFHADHTLINNAELELPPESQCQVSAMARDSAGATKRACGGTADPPGAVCWRI